MRSAAVSSPATRWVEPQVPGLAGEVAGQHQPAVDAPLLEVELEPPPLLAAALAQRERIAEPGRVGARQRPRQHEPILERRERRV